MPRTEADQNDGRLRGAYLLPLRYGPIVLCALGVTLVIYSLVAKRPNAIIVAAMTLGVLSMAAGAVMPRIRGQFEVTPTGLKGSVDPLHHIDKGMYLVRRPTEDTPSDMSVNEGAPTHPKRELNAVIQAAAAQGWSVRRTRHHVLLQGPDKKLLAVPYSPRLPDRVLQAARQLGIALPEGDS